VAPTTDPNSGGSITTTSEITETSNPDPASEDPVSGQFDSLGLVSVEWTPSVIVTKSAVPTSSYSDIKVMFNLQDKEVGWVGLGFGYDDYKMTGGKKALILSKDASGCGVEFNTLVSNTVQSVSGSSSDPWSVAVSCTVLAPTLVSLSFRIGGDSGITLPAKGTPIYVLIAGGLGSGVGNHGNTFDFKQVDFLSVDPPFGESDTPPVNPFYLAHGIIYIVTFAILMPLTSFLILINRSRFYNVHKYLGILIVLLLTVGWVLVNPGADADESGNYASFAATEIGQSHSDLGTIGCWIAVGVCTLGVVLWFIKLPKTMKKGVRYAHGIAGVALSYWGPYIVWTGWVQLQPVMPPISGLTNTPWAWLSVALILGAIYLCWFAWNFARNSESAFMGRGPGGNRSLTMTDVDAMVKSGRLVLVINGMVCEIPKSFSHPGGRGVLEHYNGQDVSRIMSGSVSFGTKGRVRNYGHSEDAFNQAFKMNVGYLSDLTASAPNLSVVLGRPEPNTLLSGTIQSMDQVNTAQDFPVRLFKLAVPEHNGKLKLGSRVYLSLQGQTLSRPYTVCKAVNGTYEFCIKIYPEGQFTSKLNNLKPGDNINVSQPVAHALLPAIPSPPSLVVFIAGGTGVAPMIGYFNECSRIPLGGHLMWWIRNEGDVFLVPQIEAWGKKFNVKIQVFFTQPTEYSQSTEISTKPVIGRISSSIVLSAFGGTLPIGVEEIAWVVSGPEGFVQSANKCLQELSVKAPRVLNLD
jgi:NAD(P)H-flavin reductase